MVAGPVKPLKLAFQRSWLVFLSNTASTVPLPMLALAGTSFAPRIWVVKVTRCDDSDAGRIMPQPTKVAAAAMVQAANVKRVIWRRVGIRRLREGC